MKNHNQNQEFFIGRKMFINAIDYLSTGDGESNDSPFMQKAINAARSANSKVVFLHPGTYLLDDVLSYPSDFIFFGDNASTIGAGAVPVIDFTLTADRVSVKSLGAKGQSTDDTEAIRKAVKVAHLAGINHIFFPPSLGHYMVDATKPIYTPSNFKVSGLKGNSVIKTIAGTVKGSPDNYWRGINSIFVPGDYETGYAYTIEHMGENIHFEDIILDGNGINIDQSGPVSEEWTGSGIHSLYVINFTVKNCEVRDFIGSGIYTYGCTRQVVKDNIVHGNGRLKTADIASRNGISFAGGYLPGVVPQQPYAFDAEISGNIVYDNSDEGIMFGYQKRILIDNNFVYGNGDRGIEGDDGYQTADTVNIPGDCIITDNFIYDHATYGMSVACSNQQKIRIEGNTIRNAPMYGILVTQNSGSDTAIVDNFIFDVGSKADGGSYSAIVVDAQSSIVQGNTIENCKYGAGIDIARATTSSIVGNKIKNTRGGVAVELWNQATIGKDVDSIKINDNEIILSTWHGIFVKSIPGYKIKSLSFGGNTVVDYAEGTVKNSCYGIVIGIDTKIKSLNINGNSVIDSRDVMLGANGIFFQNNINDITYGNICGNEVGMSGNFGPIDNTDRIEFLIQSNNNESGKRSVELYQIATPESGWYLQGDRIINTSPVAGGFLGWVCTFGGFANKTQWVTGTPYLDGKYVNNVDRVYQNVTLGTTVSGATAPTHTAGTVSDGAIDWLYIGPWAEFRTYGAITL